MKYVYGPSIAAVCGLVLLLASCGPAPVSIEDRLNSFIADLNAGRHSSVYTNTHPDAAMYNQAKVGTFWSNLFPDSDNRLDSVTPTGNVVATTIRSASLDIRQIRFTMKEDEPRVWKILRIERNDSSGLAVIFQ